jgi:hypothetical protein
VIEEWRDVDGYSGEYTVSNFGRVMSHKKSVPRLLKPGNNGKGYFLCILYPPKGHPRWAMPKTAMVHTLVAQAFLGPRPVGQEVRHLDGNSINNTLGNLAYGTHAENREDAIRHGTVCPYGHVGSNSVKCPRCGYEPKGR